MRLAKLRQTILLSIGAIALPFAIFFVYAAFSTHRARSQAEAICEAIPNGTTAQQANAKILSVDTEPRLRSPNYVGFRGFLFERWMCNLTISDGKVVDHEVRLID